MSEQSDRPSEVLGALPHRRPSRPSEKRAAAARSQPRGQRPATKPPEPAATSSAASSSPPRGAELVGTAVQAAAELAEIGLSATARAIREALARLPRP